MLSTGSDWCRLNELAITGLLKEEGRIASSENKKAALNGAARSQTPYASSRSHWWGGTSATSVDVCIAPHECLNRSSHGRSQVVSKRTNVINRFFGRCRTPGRGAASGKHPPQLRTSCATRMQGGSRSRRSPGSLRGHCEGIARHPLQSPHRVPSLDRLLGSILRIPRADRKCL
jgi:hypothetical protein